jgi:hypothetical protein
VSGKRRLSLLGPYGRGKHCQFSEFRLKWLLHGHYPLRWLDANFSVWMTTWTLITWFAGSRGGRWRRWWYVILQMYYFKYLPFSAPDGAVEGTLVLMSVGLAWRGRAHWHEGRRLQRSRYENTGENCHLQNNCNKLDCINNTVRWDSDECGDTERKLEMKNTGTWKGNLNLSWYVIR